MVPFNEMSKEELIALQDGIFEKIRKCTTLAETAQIYAEFLASLSHEIRTSMSSVIGFADLLKHTSLDAQQREYVLAICESGNLLFSLTHDALDMFKLEYNQLKLEEVDFDLQFLVADALGTLRQKVGVKPLELTVFYSETMPTYFSGDPLRIRQIFLYLIDNAIKHTGKENITVTVSIDDNAPQDEKGESTVYVSIQDTAKGIQQNVYETHFNSFSQINEPIPRNFGETGLGLSMAKTLVQKMGGTIAMASGQGKGSKFTFTLRLKKASQANKPPQTAVCDLKNKSVVYEKKGSTHDAVAIEKTEPSMKEISVLLAEDNLLNQKLMIILLKRMECNVEIANNGHEAVLKAANKNYDVILMDIQMPIMDGLEATELLRNEMNVTTPIIALTAMVSKETDAKCMAIGMNDFLTKPVEFKVLKEKILKCARK
jgi:CheY-like chemotaxis protein/nitrogen-specific signal transduction histidine kinase